jgi:hypothetical protein
MNASGIITKPNYGVKSLDHVFWSAGEEDSGRSPFAAIPKVVSSVEHEALILPPMSESSTVLVSVHGSDHPGITAGLMRVLDESGALSRW